MKIAVLLHGQIRTLKYCLPSIKRLFKELLNAEFYVCINTNNDTRFENNLCDGGFSNEATLDINELDELISSLNPIFYEKIQINKKKLISEYKKYKSMINKYNIFNTTWEEYKKTPVNKNLNNLNICREYGVNLKQIPSDKILPFIVEANSVEEYLRNYLIYNLHKIGKKYDYVALIRTDTLWCENYDTMMTTLKHGDYMYYSCPSLSNLDLKESIEEYNKNIDKVQFKDLIKQIYKSFDNNLDVISLYIKNENLNIVLPIEHAGLFRYNNIVPCNTVNESISFEEFKKNILKLVLDHLYSNYPIMDTGHYWGEQSQKRKHILYNNNISEEFQLANYARIIRN